MIDLQDMYGIISWSPSPTRRWLDVWPPRSLFPHPTLGARHTDHQFAAKRLNPFITLQLLRLEFINPEQALTEVNLSLRVKLTNLRLIESHSAEPLAGVAKDGIHYRVISWKL